MSYTSIRQREEALEAKFENAGICFGGIFDCDCACAAAPNFDSTAAASKEAAEITAQLGREQLAESKRQYDLNQAVSKPVTEAQVKLMDQSYEQGNANYNRMVTQGQPIQDQMKTIAMGGDYNAAQQAKQEEAAGTAMADARAGTAQQQNQLIRQGLRYGWSPSRLASMGGQAAQAGASAQVAAANGARTQKQAQQWGQMGDTYNTYAGLGSQAPAFYNAGTQAGNGAVGNQTAVSGQFLNANNQGAATIANGQALKLQGLGSVLNAQTSYANAQNAAMSGGGGSMGGLGSLMGGAASLYTAFSDVRLKENVEEVGYYENGLPMYEFNYIGNDARFRGVMAQDVLEIQPDAISYSSDGYMMVNYGMLGIEMERV
jgi:hypothetical protein